MTFFSFLFHKRFPRADARATIAAAPLTVWKLVAIGLSGALIAAVYVFIIVANNKLLVTIPASGGTLTEGIIGAPRSINPLSAVTDTDMALTHLIYAGLMKENGDGSTSPELAQAYEISPDDRTYTFQLRDHLSFSNGTPLTATDVAATITALQDPAVNPRSASYWQTVSISTPDPHTVIATVPTPDDSFLEHMTVGIVEAAALQQEDTGTAGTTTVSDLIGAGPFTLASVSYDESGAPKKLHFVRNRQYALGKPLLSALDIVVYANQNTLRSALARGDIDVTFALAPETLTPDRIPSDVTVTAIPTEHTMALWQLSNSELGSDSLRATLNRFIDKSSIVAKIENGYGIAPASAPSDTSSASLSLEDAQLALQKSGYTVTDGVLSRGKTPVTLSIATLNDPKLLATAHLLGESLAALGTVTQVLSFDQGTLTTDVAQQKLPIILTDGTMSLPSAYTQAIPLYTTATVLAATDEVHGVAVPQLISPTLRYATVTQWHTRTNRVWPFFVPHQ